MKKILPLLLIAVFFASIRTSADIIEIEYDFKNLKVLETDGYQIIRIENTFLTGIVGEPMLPYQVVKVMLPPGHVAESIEIFGEGEVELQGSFYLYPQQYSQPLSVEPEISFVLNHDIYTSPDVYPEDPIGHLSTHFMNGYSFALSSFTPLIYNPSDGRISYFKKVKAKIKTRKSAGSTRSVDQLLSSSPSVLNKVSTYAQNPEMLKKYPQHRAMNNSYQLLIITPQAFESAFNELRQSYLEKGMNSELATIEYIQNNQGGADLQEKIRNYIIQQYSENQIEDVLLGGDVEHVPYRGFYCHVQSSSVYEDDDIPSDLYYSSLDGNWNTNGNSLWGEIGEDDLLPEVAVARMPFSTIDELNNMLHKTMAYQDQPVENGELNRPLLAGEHLWDDPLTYGGDYLDLLIGEHDDNGYSTTGIAEDDDYEKLYARDANWGASTLLSKINEGKSFIHHSGHANATYVMFLSNSDITNDNFSQVNGVDHNYTLVYTHGCICGSFDNSDCIAEKMVTLENFAAAFVGNSRYGWFNEGQTEGPSGHLHREFVDALYHDKLNTIARAHMESRLETAPWVNAPGQHEEGALRWCFYDCNVLGDPAMAIWTDNPYTINVDYSTNIPIGAPSTQISVISEGEPVENAMCVILKDGIMHGKALSDQSGTALIEFTIPFTELGDAQLIVSGYNIKKHVYDISIIPNEGAYVIYDAYTINDASGNNDGFADYGESVQLGIDLTNVGTQASIDGVVTLTCENGYVNILDDETDTPAIEGGETISLNNAFQIELANNIPDMEMLNFEILVDAGDTWSSSFSFMAHAPQLLIQNYAINDTEGGNGNGIIDPGESISLSVSIINDGHSDCSDALANLSSSSSYITIANPSVEVGDMIQGTSYTIDYNIDIDETAPIGSAIDFDMMLEAGMYGTQMNIGLTIGLIKEDFETADFSQYSWVFGGSSNWTICDQNPWEGDYCSKSGDISDNQNTEMIIELEVLSDDSISFFRKVSSEADYDFLYFYIDGNKMDEWSGEMDWSRVAYPVNEGVHTFKWEYYKDVYVSGGEDCAWIDYIVFPPAAMQVGLPENNAELDVSVYPNPAQDILHFFIPDSDKIKIELYNSSGQLAHQYNPGQHSGEISLNTSSFKEGIYFCRIYSGEHLVLKKVIIKH